MAKNSDKILAIGVGLNLDPLNKDINDASKAAKSGMEQLGQSVASGASKAGESVVKAADKVQSLKAQLRTATMDAQQMAEKFGVMSQQAIQSASKAGELKDKIGDMNTVINAFSADSKFTVVAGALQQAAGAASIVTGAMGLLGTESKETQAMLLKVQSALALTQGLAQIKEMGASFTALKAVIAGQVIPSIIAMNSAMLLGIGVAIVAVGAITLAVYKYTESLNAERAAIERVNEAQVNNAKNLATINGLIIETENLRINSAGKTLNAEIDANKQSLAAAIKANDEKFEKLQNTGVDQSKLLFQQVQQQEYIELEHKRKEKEIRESYAKLALADAKKHHKELNVIYSLPIEIQNQYAGGGQMELPSIVGPSKPTKQGLDEKETLAFKIRQEADNARKAMLNAKVILMEAQEKMFNSIAEQKEALINSVFNGIGRSIGNSIAQSLSGENSDPFADIGVVLVKSLGEMASMLGAQLIAIGSGMLIAGIPNGLQYIAGGTALVIAGAAASGLAGRKSPSTGASSSGSASAPSSNFNSGSASNYIGGNNSGNIVINGMIKGNDIQLVNGRNDRKFNRSLRFG